MELQERKDRFTEIIMAVDLLPEDLEEKPLLPSLTLGLADPNLRSAVISQAFREGEDFSQKLTNALAVSAVESINRTEGEVTPDDMSALGLSASLAWAYGQTHFLMKICGVVAEITEHTDADVPLDFSMIFRPNAEAVRFGEEYEPYDLLDGEQGSDRARALAEEVGLDVEGLSDEEILIQLRDIVKDRIFGAE